MRSGRSYLARVVLVALGVLCMAPTAGDVGGCGTEVQALDKENFGAARKRMDCERCRECSIPTARCGSACDANVPAETRIPDTCQPLLHDGEVCIRKLKAASCDAYGTYVSDLGPSTPSECEFCKVPPESASPGPGFVADASTGRASWSPTGGDAAP